MPIQSPGSTGKEENFRMDLVLGVTGTGQKVQESKFFKRVDKTLQKLGKQFKNMGPIWNEIQALVMSEINRTFEEEGKNLYAGMAWPPLNQTYAKRKREEVGPRKMLVYSGVMKASVQVERKTNNLLKITARDPKAKIHQYGGKIPGKQGTMTKRPFMILTKEAKRGISKIFNEAADAAMQDRKRKIAYKKGVKKFNWMKRGR